jgi:hypothetical protein
VALYVAGRASIVVVSAIRHQVVIDSRTFLSRLSLMLRRSPEYLLLCTVLVSCGWCREIPSAHGQTLQAAAVAVTPSIDSHPILVELFTSEGCSSCPPADSFVQKLDMLQPVAGAQLIVLSEHVDYWDHDGWKDPNSSRELTERQSAYVHVLGLSTAYTPQIIVDGVSEMRLGDPQQVEKAFQQAAASPKVAVRIGTVDVDQGNPGLLRTRVETNANTGRHNADVYVAIALDHVESQVLRGENGGRRLTHTAVVQEISRIGKIQKGKSFAEDVHLKLKAGTDPISIRVVAFVQEPGPGKLLGAALWKAGAEKVAATVPGR